MYWVKGAKLTIVLVFHPLTKILADPKNDTQ
jgi:hypothetical protein